MSLQDVWFLLIAVLWIGYFFLEGFDFGVGILLPVLGRDDTERRVLVNTIGPVWDGNEVWLLVAGGATFAAFPAWYATLFSGFYLALLVILVALIVRGVAFEFRGKVDSDRWRANWDRAIFWGSLVPALLWGVAFGNIVRGVHLDKAHQYSGNFFDLLNPYALLGGLTTLVLFTLHGAVFVALKTTDDLRSRANALAGKVGLVAIVIAASFLLWTQLAHGGAWSAVFSLLAALCLIGAVLANRVQREGWAFVLSGATIAAAVTSLFVGLYPDVLPAMNPANSLTIHNASSTHYTLVIMTWVAVVFTPIVLAYQAWTYWVFRQRISTKSIPPAPPEASAVPDPRRASGAPVA